MIRSTIQFFYTAGPRISIKSTLSQSEIERLMYNARETGELLKLESLPENPRDEKGKAFVYLDLIGLAFVSFVEELEKPTLVQP